jgi:RNA polymerase subunit RPABC4/transcription elongation factor Spt4
VDDPISIETVSTRACLECGRLWVDETEHWRAYLDEDGEVLLYCPVCASREFDA